MSAGVVPCLYPVVAGVDTSLTVGVGGSRRGSQRRGGTRCRCPAALDNIVRGSANRCPCQTHGRRSSPCTGRYARSRNGQGVEARERQTQQNQIAKSIHHQPRRRIVRHDFLLLAMGIHCLCISPRLLLARRHPRRRKRNVFLPIRQRSEAAREN